MIYCVGSFKSCSPRDMNEYCLEQLVEGYIEPINRQHKNSSSTKGPDDGECRPLAIRIEAIKAIHIVRKEQIRRKRRA